MTDPVGPYLAFRDQLISDGWTDGAERTLSDLMDAAVVELAGDPDSGTAVVATGGYGRGVMAVRSDVDLLFLHTSGGEDELAKRMLRPLWDAKLKVGHLSHEPKAARVFAGTRLDAISTFLSARLICGDEEVFADFQRHFTRLLEKEHARIVGSMAAEERRRRTEEPYRLMAADLKNGRGGLRTLDMVDWRRRLFRAQAADVGKLPIDDGELRIRLTMVRSAVHVAAGRLYDSYDFELREHAASWLGMSVGELGVEVMALRNQSERLVDLTWTSLAHRPKQAPMPDALRPDNRGDVVAFFTEGFVSRIPDLARINDVPHVAPFHRHPLADHTLKAVDLAWQVVDREIEDPVAREAAVTLERPERLVIAALLHDVGKGLGSDHSRAGAALAPDLLAALGIDDPDDVDLYVRLIEQHLLLADFATRLDIDDPAVIGWVTDRIPDMETLRFLHLLTIVDSLAAGPDVWTEWRAELLRRAYRRLEREIRRRELPDEAQVMVLADQVVDVMGDGADPDEIRMHLAGFGAAYRRSHSPVVIGEHIRLGRSDQRIAIVPGSPTRMIVSVPDRPRLLLDVASVLALHGMSITDARFATRTDSTVFDTFEFVAGDGSAPSAGQLDAIRRDTDRILRGGSDLSAPLAKKRHAYRDAKRSGVREHVDIDHHDDGGGTVWVEGADRVGLLVDLARVFADHRIPIQRARLDTRAGVAYDTFQVARLPVDADLLEADLRDALIDS